MAAEITRILIFIGLGACIGWLGHELRWSNRVIWIVLAFAVVGLELVLWFA